MGVPAMPAAWAADNPRLRSLMGSVWARIPEHDQAVLVAMCRAVVAGRYSEETTELGKCSDLTPDFGLSIYIDLDRIDDDVMARWILAHECAHLVLRQAGLTAALGTMGVLYPDVFDDFTFRVLHILQEAQADFLALQWGFTPEHEKFISGHPHRRPLWWLRETENDATNGE